MKLFIMPGKKQKPSVIEMNIDDTVWVRIFAAVWWQESSWQMTPYMCNKKRCERGFLQLRVENRCCINNEYQQLIFVLLFLVNALFNSPFKSLAEWISADPKHSDQYSLQALSPVTTKGVQEHWGALVLTRTLVERRVWRLNCTLQGLWCVLTWVHLVPLPGPSASLDLIGMKQGWKHKRGKYS